MQRDAKIMPSINIPASVFTVLVLALMTSIWAITQVNDIWKGNLSILSIILLITIVCGEFITAYLDRKHREKLAGK